MDTKSNHTSFIPCTWQPQQGCNGCAGAGHLMCRFRWGDMGVFAGLDGRFGLEALLPPERAGDFERLVAMGLPSLVSLN